MIASSSGDNAYCELRFRPNVELVSTVRKFVSSFYVKLLDGDATERLALATHELLENAVKYSSTGETAIRIDIESVDPPRICIRTWNQASPEHVAQIVEAFRQSCETSNAFTLYQRLIERSATRTSGSGLGLARVRAECDMELSYVLDEDEVCIVARPTLVRSPS
jgi:hypothetical protein